MCVCVCSMHGSANKTVPVIEQSCRIYTQKNNVDVERSTNKLHGQVSSAETVDDFIIHLFIFCAVELLFPV